MSTQNFSSSEGAYAVFRAVRQIYPEDVAAFANLRALYCEFYDGLDPKPY